jgi:hypothetical protein
VVACVVNLLPLCKYEKIRLNEKSYCPFFLLKIGKICANYLDANLIQIAPECRDTCGACLSVSLHFWPKCVLSAAIKECVKRHARDWISLNGLRPTRGVVSCH